MNKVFSTTTKKHGKNDKTNLVQPLSQKLKEMLLALIGLGAS